jgi:hypothetical protein
MIPFAFPTVSPVTTLGDLFGPLASIAVFGVLAGLGILLVVVALQAWATAPRQRHGVAPRPAHDSRTQHAPTLRPAA